MPEIDLGGVVGPQGPRGIQGIQGPEGIQGPAGPGLPIGGTVGQVPVKASDVDYDTAWKTLTADDVGARSNLWLPTPTEIGAASNQNLLDNWYFADPVNQQGKTEYIESSNVINRWKTNGGTLTLVESGLKLEDDYVLFQIMDGINLADGKQRFISYMDGDGNVYSGPLTASYARYGDFSFCYDTGIALYIRSANSDKVIRCVKLELGNKQTLAHQDSDGNWILTDPPNYALQYAICSQYSPITGEWVGFQTPPAKELTESWSSLRSRIQAGNFDGIRVGDYKTITLTTGEVVVMEVAGIDPYYRCGDIEIGHHIDFISRDCLAGGKVFNETNTNNGTEAEPNPWRASKLFQTLNNETTGVYATLPADLKPCIIEKRALLESRYSSAGALSNSAGWAWNNMGKLWIPTEVEVFGNTFWSDGDAGYNGGGGCNLQYPIFSGGSKHIIKGAGNGGGRCGWWEASATRQSAAYVCYVDGHGGANGDWASGGWVRSALCFRIG